MTVKDKKSSYSPFLNLFFLLACCLPLCGCTTDSLAPECIVSPKPVEISCDWSADPGASPKGMRLWVYSSADSLPGDFNMRDLNGRQGGEIRMFPGKYKVLAYNNDSEWVRFDGTQALDGHTASTGEAGLLDGLGDTGTGTRSGSCGTRFLTRGDSVREPVRALPDELWCDTAFLSVGQDTARLTLRPKPVHCRYDFVVRNVEGIGRVQRLSASISGMAQSVDVASGRPSAESCSHPLTATLAQEGDSITGSFLAFGPAAEPSTRSSVPRNRMAFYMILKDGNTYKFTQGDKLDVTDQIRNAADPKHVKIVIDGLKVPELNKSQGWDMTLDDWPDVNIDINI